MSKPMLSIDYFSDVLCIWAYVAQPRIDRFYEQFSGQVQMQHRFIPIFGNAKHRISTLWAAKGGFGGFNEHLRAINEQFDHIDINQELWIHSQPSTSATAHLFLKAIDLWQREQGISCSQTINTVATEIRRAFFDHARNVSHLDVLYSIIDELEIPRRDIQPFLDDGRALAGLYEDSELQHENKIEGSPTFVINEGRQKLYGNVGYKIIEANIHELLSEPNKDQASWC